MKGPSPGPFKNDIIICLVIVMFDSYSDSDQDEIIEQLCTEDEDDEENLKWYFPEYTASERVMIMDYLTEYWDINYTSEKDFIRQFNVLRKQKMYDTKCDKQGGETDCGWNFLSSTCSCGNQKWYWAIYRNQAYPQN